MQQKQGLFVSSFNAHTGNIYSEKFSPPWSPSWEEMQG